VRKVFEFLTLFDWITPAIGVFESLANDPLQMNTWTFFIPYDEALDAGWNANGIRRLMGKHGISYWGEQFAYPNGVFFFKVRLEQAQWAEYLLLRYGVPLHKRFKGAPRVKGRRHFAKSSSPLPETRDTFLFPNDFIDTFLG
jgi:hypothetical protein